MKGSRLVILALCVLLLWIVSPAWSDEGTPQETVPAVQAQTGQPASEPPVQPAAAPAVEQPAAEQPVAQPPAEPVVPTPVAEQPPAVTATQEGPQIQDAVVCQDVVDRTPVGSGDVFSKDAARVYCYCRVVGIEGESFITHNWYYKGALKASVQLPVRSNSWRTYSSKTMIPEWSGEWMVEILSEAGTPLESIIFFIQ